MDRQGGRRMSWVDYVVENGKWVGLTALGFLVGSTVKAVAEKVNPWDEETKETEINVDPEE